MKNIIILLLLLVSGNAIGQATEPLRRITVKRLLGHQPTVYHVAETGQAPSTYHGNYHTSSSNREDINIGIRFDVTSNSDVEGLLIYNGNTYVMEHTYAENMDLRYITPAFRGDGYAINENRQLVGNVIVQPPIFNDWDEPSASGINEHAGGARVVFTQYNCAIGSNECLEREVTVIRTPVTSNYYFALGPDSDAQPSNLLLANGTDADAIRLALAAGHTQLFRGEAYGWTATWEAGSMHGQTWQADSFTEPIETRTTLVSVSLE